MGFTTHLLTSTCTHEYTVIMSTLIIRTSAEQIELELISQSKSKTLRRPANEDVIKFLAKITGQYQKLRGLKKAKVVLEFQKLDHEVNILENFRVGYNFPVMVMKDGEKFEESEVVRNPPTIDDAQFNVDEMKIQPMVGVQIFAFIKHRYCEYLKFEWYRNSSKDLSLPIAPIFTSNRHTYTPVEADLNNYLALKITCGATSKLIFSSKVQSHSSLLTQDFPFQKRASMLPQKSRSILRTVCYNILFCEDSRDAWRQVSAEHLSMGYRLPLITDEIKAYKSDIIALQEVTARVFNNWLTPALTESNFQGVFAKRNEGNSLATFWNSSRFELIESCDCEIRKLVNCKNEAELKSALGVQSLRDEDIEFYLNGFKNLENEYPVLHKELNTPSTVAQIVALVDLEMDRIVLIGNTHLTGNGRKFWHVRPLQAKAMADCLLAKEQELMQKFPQRKIFKMILGDLNSCHTDTTVRILKGECVPSFWFKTKKSLMDLYGISRIIDTDTDYYRSMCEYEQQNFFRNSIELLEVEDENYAQVLACGLELTDALDNEDIWCTSFTRNYKDRIDYVLFDDSLAKVEYTLPTPAIELLTQETALPSSIFPSDHISQLVDFSYL